MGVRGLQTYLEQYCPSACRSVDVIELAKKYKNETGNDAVIVVDTQSFYWTWCTGMDCIIGYEIQEYLHRLRTFVESFEKLGVKLVFFMNGITVEKKRDKWRSRKTKNLQDTHRLFDFLKMTGNRTTTIPEQHIALPPSIGIISSMLLKHVLKCEVYMTIEERDEEIIEYVHKNECMGIFTQDSDFIVRDVAKCKVLSSKKFDQKRMTTLLYDREALAMSLKIRTDQLPLLAILAGNDCIDYELMRTFHRSLCGVRRPKKVAYDKLMPAIGRYINTLSNQPIDKILETISVKIFGNKSSLDVVKCSYNGYMLQKERDNSELTNNPSTDWSRILNEAQDRHKKAVAPSYIWGIVKDKFFELGATFEDLRKPFSQQIPSAVVTRVLRQRMYGILMYEYEHLRDVKIEEWCAENTLSYQLPVLVEPTTPTLEHPGLLRLWSDKNDDELGEIKWKLFLWIISPNLIAIEDWQLLTTDLVAVAATLFYLIEQKFIDEEEVNAVVATIATYSLHSRENLNSLDYNGVHNPRCTHISICVIRTFTFVVTAMAACGYPVPLSGDLVYLKLEAKLFQIKFKEMTQKKSVEEMCENNEKSIEIFNQMKKVLGPAFEKSSLTETESEGKKSENRADDGDKHTEGDDVTASLAELKV